ncbi:hypothetical protein F5Y16DRAFT_391196 [Xylariaceae sp. FL0255]|nr:hypothetical protein F5Y16DRAFT_391196 [Xylariaceae sp. FL0255]
MSNRTTTTMLFTTATEAVAPSNQLQMFDQLMSKPVRFIIGKEREECYLHLRLLSQMSPMLDTLVRDGMRGSLQSTIDWEDVPRSIFERFAEFAYKGNYSGEKPMKSNAMPPEPPKEYSSDIFALPYTLRAYNLAATNWRGIFDTCPHEGGEIARRFGSARCDCGPSDVTKYHISTFLSRYCDSVDVGATNTQRQWTGPMEHLICHIQMWIIADKYAVDSLMGKASSELAIGLADWLISPSAFVPQFEKLVRYIYTNTVGQCQLREIVASFAACVIADVFALEGWKALLENTPGFMMDLIRHMTQRVSINHLPKPNHHPLFGTT